MAFLLVDKDGLVVNAIEYDGVANYNPPRGLSLVEIGDSGAWIGWIYNAETGEFTPPAE